MNTTSRNKNLIVIIAVLLLTNIAVLAYFLWFNKSQEVHGDNKNRNGNGIAEQLEKEVGFNSSQLGEYKTLKERQREVIRPMFDEMRKSKDSLFRLLGTPGVSDSLINSAADGIARQQKKLDIETFHHFQRVRALCKPDQESKYDSLILRMFRKMGKPRNENEKAEKQK